MDAVIALASSKFGDELKYRRERIVERLYTHSAVYRNYKEEKYRSSGFLARSSRLTTMLVLLSQGFSTRSLNDLCSMRLVFNPHGFKTKKLREGDMVNTSKNNQNMMVGPAYPG
ncbi:hypothetical protein LguiB_024839 [Lonicera macranthoides]